MRDLTRRQFFVPWKTKYDLEQSAFRRQENYSEEA